MTSIAERARAAEAAAAEQLAAVPDWLWDGKSLPVPVESIADNHYGLLVQEEEELGWVAGLGIHAQVSGLLLPHAREIWVDSEEARVAPGRRRFTIGHELGHWVLHCGLGERGDDDGIVHCRNQVVLEAGAVEKDDSGQHLAKQRPWYPPEELEANQFGAAMLMPADLVRTIRERLGTDLGALATAFGVSTMAMERRMWFLRRHDRG
jgi:hypothetical protein